MSAIHAVKVRFYHGWLLAAYASLTAQRVEIDALKLKAIFLTPVETSQKGHRALISTDRKKNTGPHPHPHPLTTVLLCSALQQVGIMNALNYEW